MIRPIDRKMYPSKWTYFSNVCKNCKKILRNDYELQNLNRSHILNILQSIDYLWHETFMKIKKSMIVKEVCTICN